MKVIQVNNVNRAVHLGIKHLLEDGVEETSRNGPVLVAPGPVCTEYHRPTERVLFSPTRDANPFFHLMESLWMLAGRHDLAFPLNFNSRFGEYSDDGETVYGAYGWRWRAFHGYDQLKVIAEELKKNPTSRRCVLSMWNGFDITCYDESVTDPHHHSDLFVAMHGGKDVPCNTHAYFDCRGGMLNMTVCNRSNDAIWGAYGANAVHFSVLQEYLAAWIGVPVGLYRQISNNFHAYIGIYDREKLAKIAEEAEITDKYTVNPKMAIIPLMTEPELEFREKLFAFMEGKVPVAEDNFFTLVAAPMATAWFAWKEKDFVKAREALATMPYCDWYEAATQWLQRREEKQNVHTN